MENLTNEVSKETGVNEENAVEVVKAVQVKETDEKKSKKTKNNPISDKVILKTVNYTEQELYDFIKKKYSEHHRYYHVLKFTVDNICNKELKELNEAVDTLEKELKDPSKLTIDQLKPYVITIPILMYKVNNKLGEQALNMEITEHLNNLEITEKLTHIFGGTEKERIRQAEYNSMVSTFTLLVKTRVYYNIKNCLDYAGKLNDGIKKALSAEIEELKVFGNSTSAAK